MQLQNLHNYTLDTLLSQYPNLQIQVYFGLQKHATDILKLHNNTIKVNCNTYLDDEFIEKLQFLLSNDQKRAVKFLNIFYSKLFKLKYTQFINLISNKHNQLLNIISHTKSNLTRYIEYKLKVTAKITTFANYLPIQSITLNSSILAVKNSCLNGKIYVQNFGIQITIYTTQQSIYTSIDNTNSILLQIRDIIKQPIHVRVFLLAQAQHIRDVLNLNNLANIGVNTHAISKTFYLYPY